MKTYWTSRSTNGLGILKPSIRVFPLSTIAGPPHLRFFYEELRPVLYIEGSVSIFPPESERFYADSKIRDIRALDNIALEQKLSGNERFAYRPRTCPGIGECQLADLAPHDPVVLKRSHSAGSEHVA